MEYFMFKQTFDFVYFSQFKYNLFIILIVYARLDCDSY
ncbi:hypothetical protein J2772_003912 [Chryseobacterium jejuense]|nr:hypothetical protein [Chryseobacterium jejuense]